MPRPHTNADGALSGSGTSEAASACPRPEKERERLWIVAGDIHGDASLLADTLAAVPELPRADGVIITGDISRAGGGIPSARAVVEAAEELCPVVLAQIGNIDQPQVDAWLDERGINLHRKAREIAPDTAIIGVGGSTFTPFGTPSEFPEARYAEWLKELAARAADHKRLILVSHNPPKDTVCDRTGSGQHVGSRAVREFIEERQPAVCLCGHVHEAAGMQLVGRTQVLNPGSLGSGGYALLRLGEETTLIPRRIGA